MPKRLTSSLAQHAPRWLQRPPFSTLIDAQLWVVTLILHPRTFRRMLSVHYHMMAISGVELGLHFYGGIAYILEGRELAHLHGDGLLDAYVGSQLSPKLLADGAVQAHHADGGPGWVTVDLDSEAFPSQLLLHLIRTHCDVGVPPP